MVLTATITRISARALSARHSISAGWRRQACPLYGCRITSPFQERTCFRRYSLPDNSGAGKAWCELHTARFSMLPSICAAVRRRLANMLPIEIGTVNRARCYGFRRDSGTRFLRLRTRWASPIKLRTIILPQASEPLYGTIRISRLHGPINAADAIVSEKDRSRLLPLRNAESFA